MTKEFKIAEHIYIDLHQDWDSFIFWKPYNWRDFTFIHFSVEVNEGKFLELSIALLGFHFDLDWWRPQEHKEATELTNKLLRGEEIE